MGMDDATIKEFSRYISSRDDYAHATGKGNISEQEFRQNIKEYFDRKGGYPEQYAPEEYSFYFEQCYNDPLARKRFIESIVSARKPSIGYLCLAEAVAKGKVKNVWTTNFDPLLENALVV